MGGGGFFCKKVENGGCFVKNGPFLNAGRIMYSRPISIFLFYILLIWGCVHTQRTPCLRAWFVFPKPPGPIRRRCSPIRTTGAHHQLTLSDHGHEDSPSRGRPVYAAVFACTILYYLATGASGCEQLAQSRSAAALWPPHC